MTDERRPARTAAVRPPEYWPSPLFFALADRADVLVLADTLQYSRQSFQNRARLRTPQDWQWVSVPLKGGQHGRPICEVAIRNSVPWQGKHRRSLHFNYRASPFFEFYEPQLRTLLDRKWDLLGELTCKSVEVLADLLGLSTPVIRASALGGRPDAVPEMLDRVDGDVLLAGSDTAEVDRRFASSVRVLDLQLPPYRQNFEGFVSGMSTLDLLFNYGPETLSMIRRATMVERDSEVVSRAE